jgi:hypothetical protein
VAYKRGILFLLGPLPCGVLAFWLAIAKWTTGIPELGSAALTAAILGGFGLLPLAQSDGGRLLELTLFCRHPIAEAIFVVLTCAASVAVGVALEAWFIVGIGAIGVVALPWRLRSAQAARRLRETAPELRAPPISTRTPCERCSSPRCRASARPRRSRRRPPRPASPSRWQRRCAGSSTAR